MVDQPKAARLTAIDRMRGLVMMLMAIDHASAVFNREKVSRDSYALGAAGAPLGDEPIHFLTRWITHLCAPTFVFLAGTALALSVAKRVERGSSGLAIDGHLLVRGVILIALELWMCLVATFPVQQVLSVIGLSIVCMVVLRRLPSLVLCALGFGWIVFGEVVVEWLEWTPVFASQPLSVVPSFNAGLLAVAGIYELPFDAPAADEEFRGQLLMIYPLLPWLAIMMLGWSFGRWLVGARTDEAMPRRAARRLLVFGLLGLGAFVVQRAIDDYGNYWLPRGDDDSLIRWLQVSKYPPSLAFCGLELGLMCLLLAAMFRLGGSLPQRGPMLLLGRTALFFYLIHFHILWLVRIGVQGVDGYNMMFDPPPPYGIASAWIGAAGIILLMLPLCAGFAAAKARRPDSWLRFF